jgi:molecular chaperone IbpA
MQNNMRAFDPFFSQSLGLENIFNSLQEFQKPNSKYPPYNIVKGPYSYAIQFALAGWRMDELSINIEKNVLTVKGDKDYSIKNDEDQFVHQGISERSFIQQFTIGDKVFINDATLNNGMLEINMGVTIPEEEKSINIPINSQAELLMENS